MEESQSSSSKTKQKDPIWKHAKFKPNEYRSPSDLWDDATQYFDWCDNNPVDAPMITVRSKKEKHGGHKEARMQDQRENVSRPYTLYGLSAFLGVRDWRHFKAKYIDKGEEWEDVIRTIENVVASQQVDGAMTGVFKENIVCRLNGFVDKVSADVNADIETNTNVKFTGFGFLPWTPGLTNSEGTRIASGEEIQELPPAEQKEEEPVIDYAEIIDAPSQELLAEPIIITTE